VPFENHKLAYQHWFNPSHLGHPRFRQTRLHQPLLHYEQGHRHVDALAIVRLIGHPPACYEASACEAALGGHRSSNTQRIARAPATTWVFPQETPLDEALDITERGVVRALLERRPLRCRELSGETVQ